MKHPHRILIIDDSSFIRMSATRMLKEMEFEQIETADNGQIGLEKFRLFIPHIVILDGIMPEVDGLTVLKTMKSEKPETYIIMSSSLSVRENIVEFKTAGADQYLLKPYGSEKFIEALHKAIGKVTVC
jgi:two-component system chemotaxis response regulator CheY